MAYKIYLSNEKLIIVSRESSMMSKSASNLIYLYSIAVIGYSGFIHPGFPGCCFNPVSNRPKFTSLPLNLSNGDFNTLIKHWFPSLKSRPFVLCKMISNNVRVLEAKDWGTPKKIFESKFKGVIFIKTGRDGK